MSAQVEGSKQVILERANALPPAERLHYLELVASHTASGIMVFIDTEHMEDMTPEINAWVTELIRTEPIPEGYFAFCMDKLLAAFHPMMRQGLIDGLIENLSSLTPEEAHQHGTMEGFSAEQVPILYNQMQVWLAEKQKPSTLQ